MVQQLSPPRCDPYQSPAFISPVFAQPWRRCALEIVESGVLSWLGSCPHIGRHSPPLANEGIWW